MAKGKLNTPWNRFWLLVSFCGRECVGTGASTVDIPPEDDRLAQQHGGTPAGVDYDKLAQKARQDLFVPDSTTEPKPPVKDWVDVPPGYTLDHQTSALRLASSLLNHPLRLPQL
jgi:hypothetical protein